MALSFVGNESKVPRCSSVELDFFTDRIPHMCEEFATGMESN